MAWIANDIDVVLIFPQLIFGRRAVAVSAVKTKARPLTVRLLTIPSCDECMNFEYFEGPADGLF
jgi:hypothetical protein